MKTAMIPWDWLKQTVEDVLEGKVERMDYKSKFAELKVYSAGAIIRIDIKEVKNEM